MTTDSTTETPHAHTTTAIDTALAKLTADLAAETKARLDADAALDARIKALEAPVPPIPPSTGPTVPDGLASGAITLQQAVNAAGSGATFGVPPRTYLETVTVPAGTSLIAVGGTPVIDGSATRPYGVLLSGLIDGFEVRNCATPLQDGAIRLLANGATVRRTRSHDNRGPGITFRASALVEDSEFDRNGQQGFHGQSGSGDSVMRRCHIHHNNMAVSTQPPANAHGPYKILAGPKIGMWWPYDPFWEAGAGKITRAHSMLVEDCEVDHNGGPGLWADIDSNNWTYRRNHVHDNDLSGIFFEISHGAVIEDNALWHNGECDHRGWGWPAQILVSSSVGPIECRRNVMAYGVRAISVIAQKRDIDGVPIGPLEGANIHLTDNIAVLSGPNGWYTDNATPFTGKIDTGNVTYASHTAAADAALTAAGIPLT